MYEQTLHLTDEAFRPVMENADSVLQRLLVNMMDKNSTEGTLNIKIDVSLMEDLAPNFDPAIKGDTRRVLTPKFSYKVGSMMQIKDETKGSSVYNDCEMVWDDERCEYVMKPIITSQQSLFDAGSRQEAKKMTEVPPLAGAALPEVLHGDDGEPEDVSDVFGDYPYEPSVQ